MKSKILKNIFIFLLANVLVLLHFSWRIITVYPWNLPNVIMIVFLWLIILNPREQYILIASYALLVTDLFYSSIFGIESFSQITALLLANWLLLNIFTNRSLTTVFLVGLLTMSMYKIIYIFLTFLNSSLGGQIKPDWIFLSKNFVAESIVTAIVLSIFYLLSSIFIKRLRPEYISSRHQIL